MTTPSDPISDSTAAFGTREVVSRLGVRTFTLGSDGSLWNLPGEAPMQWSSGWASVAPRTMREACVAPAQLMATAPGGRVEDPQGHHVLGIVELRGPGAQEHADGMVRGQVGRLVGLWVNKSTVDYSVVEAVRAAHQREPVGQRFRVYAMRPGLLGEVRSPDRGPACPVGKPMVLRRDPLVSGPFAASTQWQPRGPVSLEQGWIRQIVDGQGGQSALVAVVTDPAAADRVKAQVVKAVSRFRLSAAVLIGPTGLVQVYVRRRIRGAWFWVPADRVAGMLAGLPSRWAPTMLGIGDLALASLMDRDGPCSVDFEWPGGLPQGCSVEEQVVIEAAAAVLSRRWYRQAKGVIASSGWAQVVEPVVPGPVPVVPMQVARAGRESLASRGDAQGLCARELVAAAAAGEG